MSDPPPRLALIESLRTRADALRSAERTRRCSAIELIGGVDRRLRSALRWLDDALAQLEIIRPVVAHRFPLAGLVTISGLRFEGGAVARRASPGGRTSRIGASFSRR